MTILQTPHGFIMSQNENFDPENPPVIPIKDFIPAISLGKDFSYSPISAGKSVLEQVEAFFSRKETPAS